jgi:hypothetical protein
MVTCRANFEYMLLHDKLTSATALLETDTEMSS